MDWSQTTARRDDNLLSFDIWCFLYKRLYGIQAIATRVYIKKYTVIWHTTAVIGPLVRLSYLHVSDDQTSEISNPVIVEHRSYLNSKKTTHTWPSRLSYRVPVVTLRWHHNETDGVSYHRPHHCLLNRLFERGSKKTSKLHVTGLCAGDLPGTGEFPAQMASNAENVSIWWRHHEFFVKKWPCYNDAV